MEKPKTSPGKRRKKPVPPSEDMPEAPVSGAQVLLSVHLWTEGGNDPPELALAMVGDLLSASPCEVREGSSSSIAASFLDTLQAVNAARRLKRLVQAFSQTSKSGRLGACFLLSTVKEADVEVEAQVRQLLSIVARRHSGQLLVVGGLCESARLIPGSRFETLSGDWRTTQNNGLHRPVMELMPPVQMEGYVEEPLECWAQAVEPRLQAATADAIASRPFSEALPAMNQTNGAPVTFLAAETAAPAGQEIAGLSRAPKTPGRTFPLRWMAIGGAALLVLTVVAIRLSGSRNSEHRVVQPLRVARPELALPAVAPSSVTIPPRAAPTVTEEPKPVAEPVKPDAKQVRDAAKAKRKASISEQDQAVDAGDTGANAKKVRADQSGIMFSADEINSTIALADRESGDGKFDSAIRTYRIVLRHDPSNARAREGLARAIRNRGN